MTWDSYCHSQVGYSYTIQSDPGSFPIIKRPYLATPRLEIPYEENCNYPLNWHTALPVHVRVWMVRL